MHHDNDTYTMGSSLHCLSHWLHLFHLLGLRIWLLHKRLVLGLHNAHLNEGGGIDLSYRATLGSSQEISIVYHLQTGMVYLVRKRFFGATLACGVVGKHDFHLNS